VANLKRIFYLILGGFVRAQTGKYSAIGELFTTIMSSVRIVTEVCSKRPN